MVAKMCLCDVFFFVHPLSRDNPGKNAFWRFILYVFFALPMDGGEPGLSRPRFTLRVFFSSFVLHEHFPAFVADKPELEAGGNWSAALLKLNKL